MCSVARGDNAAFAELYEQTRKGIFAFVFGYCKRYHEAEDLTDREKAVGGGEELSRIRDDGYEHTGGAVFDAMNACLDGTERQIVILHVLWGYKHREIASLVDQPLGTVTWKYNNALKKLRKYMKEDDR